MSPPVVIVGAGPVGATLALLLARQGVACVVLERYEQPYPLPRAVHLDDEVLRILQDAGVAADFTGISRPMPGLRLVDAHLRTLAEFSRDVSAVGPYGYPQASMFDQPELDGLLLAAALAHPLIELRRGCPVASVDVHGRVLLASGESLDASWVVGTDGARSLVRQAISVGVTVFGREDRWWVVDVRCAAPLDVWDGVQQVCDPARTATFMHVVGDRYRWEFRMGADETPEDLARQLPSLLAPWTADEVTIVRQADYTYRACIATRWRSGRVLLAGDAAHQMPPFIGQGLGAGIRDAQNLAWKLAAVVAGADPALLDTYERERRPHVMQVMRSARLVGWVMTRGRGRAATVRRWVLRGLRQVPGFTAKAAATASPRLRLARGRLVRGRLARDRRVGTLCPQPWLGFDDLLGTGWSLVSRGPLAGAGVPVVEAPELHRWLGSTYAVLLRPDRVVAATAADAEQAAVMLRQCRPRS